MHPEEDNLETSLIKVQQQAGLQKVNLVNMERLTQQVLQQAEK